MFALRPQDSTADRVYMSQGCGAEGEGDLGDVLLVCLISQAVGNVCLNSHLHQAVLWQPSLQCLHVAGWPQGHILCLLAAVSPSNSI